VSDIPLKIDGPERSAAAATIVLAHGAGAGMQSPFMEDIARALAAEDFRVVRFEFPYMRAARAAGRGGRPDPPAVLEESWLEVISRLGSPETLLIGGKSMGGRIASMVADRAGVRALVCLGYPFHPTGKPKVLRVSHLAAMETPALILQGERDAFGSREEIVSYTLSRAIRVVYLDDGDHSFKPRKSSGRTHEENMAQAVREIAAFVASLR